MRAELSCLTFGHPIVSSNTLSVESIDELVLCSENGCLVVVPGTHKGPLYKHVYPQWKVPLITTDLLSNDNDHSKNRSSSG